jgi:hypothetical protein
VALAVGIHDGGDLVGRVVRRLERGVGVRISATRAVEIGTMTTSPMSPASKLWPSLSSTPITWKLWLSMRIRWLI